MERRNPDRRTLVNCANCAAAFLRTKNTAFCTDLCRFLAKADLSGDCWTWTATLDREGYGTFYLGRNVGAHRASLILHGRDLPDGLDVDHLCRNRACVNPDPLTFQMNRCKRGHRFAPDNTIIKGGDPSKRQCRQCMNASRRARYAELRRAS